MMGKMLVMDMAMDSQRDLLSIQLKTYQSISLRKDLLMLDMVVMDIVMDMGLD